MRSKLPMPDNRAKPMEEMTPQEIQQWKSELVARGKQPAVMVDERSPNGSVYYFDENIGRVVERTPQGARYAVAVRNGEVCRDAPIELSKSRARRAWLVLAGSFQLTAAIILVFKVHNLGGSYLNDILYGISLLVVLTSTFAWGIAALWRR